MGDGYAQKRGHSLTALLLYVLSDACYGAVNSSCKMPVAAVAAHL